MADKKTKSLEYAVDEAELIPESSIRPRSHQLMGQRISPGQMDQYLNQNKAAKAADLEDIRAAYKIGMKNSDRRIYGPDYAKGGGVTRFKDDHCGHADMKRGGSVKGKC
tara:strand:+ start:1840 stop:2166 length:327 start_codon:yes stop_codon:yes gene_type:complete